MARTRSRGGIGRRSVIKGAAGIGIGLFAPAVLREGALGATQITVADGGGPYGPAFRKAFYDPFEKATGIRVVNVARPAEPTAQFKEIVDNRTYVWDVCFLAESARSTLAREDLMEPLNIKPGDVPDLMPGALLPDWMATDVYTTVFAYRTDHFKSKAPQSLADFWDPGAFPGRRAMYRNPIWTLEQALLADGVANDKLYPLDVDRAFKSLDRIKAQVAVWWTGGAQSSELIASDEVDLISIWNARAQAEIDAGKPVKIVWNQGLYGMEGWSIPKGCPKAAEGREFIKFCADAGRQALMCEGLAYGPSNLKAFASIPKERAPILSTYPDNLKVMVHVDENWWAANRAAVFARFNTWILS